MRGINCGRFDVHYPCWFDSQIINFHYTRLLNKLPYAKQFHSPNNTIFSHLIERTTDFTTKNKQGNTLLHLFLQHVVKVDKSRCLDYLVIKTSLVNITNELGTTPLLQVSISLCKTNKQCLQNQSTDFMNIIEKLVDVGADASIANNVGIYPVHEIVNTKQLDIISKAKSNILIDNCNRMRF